MRLPPERSSSPHESPAAADAEPPRIGIVGLGLMGTALAERFLERGWDVRVWNRTEAKAEPLLRQGARWEENPLRNCPRVLLSLYTTCVVESVLDHLRDGLLPGRLILDTTTGDPGPVGTLAARLAGMGVTYLDTPLSGSSEQTRRGEATILAGGDEAAVRACADLWPILGSRFFHVGPAGSATRMKLVSNLVLGLNRAALAEGLAFAEAVGVAPAAALEVLAGSMAYSRAMDAKGRKMVQADFTPQARLSQHLKDVRLMLAAAAEAGLPLPLSETHRRLLEEAVARGLGELDNSVILEVLRHPTPSSAEPLSPSP